LRFSVICSIGLFIFSLVISPEIRALNSAQIICRRTKQIPEFIAKWQDSEVSKLTISGLSDRFDQIGESTTLTPYQKSAAKFKLFGAILADFISGERSADGIMQELADISEQGIVVNRDVKEFLAFLTNSPPLNKIAELFNSIDGNRISLEAQEEAMRQAQSMSFNDYVNAVSERTARLDAGRKLSGEIASIKSIPDIGSVRFFSNYISELKIRAKAISNENVLYAVAQNDLKVAVIPLEVLNYARGPNGEFEWCFDHVTMRQYIAFHLGRSNIYGLAMTEAENKPASVQGAHSHGNFEEETIFLSGNVQITSGEYVSAFSKSEGEEQFEEFRLSSANQLIVLVTSFNKEIISERSDGSSELIKAKFRKKGETRDYNIEIPIQVLTDLVKLNENQTITIGGHQIEAGDMVSLYSW